MHRPRRVLLVYALPHSGHSSAAAALQEELEGQGFEVCQYNFQEQWTRLGKKASGFQKWIVEHAPWVWRHAHGNKGYAGVTDFVVEQLTRWDITGLFAKIQSYKPDAIIATHFLPLRMLGEARLSGYLPMPIFAVTTDLWVHRYWAHVGIDQYFAATKQTKEHLVEYGINPARVQVTGIPLRRVFFEKRVFSSRQARAKLGITLQKPHVTIVGGSLGIFPFRDLLRAIVAEQKASSIQWTVIFGTDEKNLKRSKRFLRKYPQVSIQLLGFTKEIDLYFLASDAVVTKPGGLTTCEVALSKVPLVLCSPIPGQEEGNAAILCSAEAALREDDPALLVRKVLELVASPPERQRLAKKAAQLVPGKSSHRIARAVETALEQKK